MMNIAYLRCSTDIQDVQHQENSIKDYCKRNNITIDKIIKDEGVSAYNRNVTARKGFQEVLHLGHQGEIENLIVFESSRISRQFIEGQTLIDELTKCNVSIHSVMDNRIINQDELDQLFNSFKFFMNMKASKETSERIKSSKKLYKSQGRYLGGKILRGFKVDENGFEVIDENTKDEIIQMFNDYIAYSGGYCIKKYGLSCHQILLQKLKNKKYIKIVGQTKFNQTQTLIKERTTVRGKTVNTNKSDVLYEGLIYHAYCGRKMVIERDKKNNPVWRCKHCKGNPNILAKKSFTGLKLMKNIDEEVMEILNTLDRNKLEERYNSKCNKNKTIISHRIKELNNLSKSKNKALKLAQIKLETYIIEDANDNTINAISDVITKLKSEINEIDTELEKKQQILSSINIENKIHEEMIEKILEIKDIYAGASNIKKKAILKILIKKIVVSDIDKFDIYLNI